MKKQTKLITGIADLTARLHPRSVKTRRQSTKPSPIASPLRTLFGLAVVGGLTVQMTLGMAAMAQAQTFTVLMSFTGSHWEPKSGPVLSGGTLYGVTWMNSCGGTPDDGTVYRVNTDGTGYAMLKIFTGSDGRGPNAGLVLSGGTLYGTTLGGGSSDNGTVFRIDLPPTVLTADGSGSFITNGFGCDLSGMAGQTVVIEASTNLAAWTPLLTNSPPTGCFHFNDPDSTNFTQRFYRARLTP